jgi:hypothetical protein
VPAKLVFSVLAFLIASRCATIAARSSTNLARCFALSALYGVAGNFARIASNSQRVRSTSEAPFALVSRRLALCPVATRMGSTDEPREGAEILAVLVLLFVIFTIGRLDLLLAWKPSVFGQPRKKRHDKSS